MPSQPDSSFGLRKHVAMLGANSNATITSRALAMTISPAIPASANSGSRGGHARNRKRRISGTVALDVSGNDSMMPRCFKCLAWILN
jgi:hypothetical protein